MLNVEKQNVFRNKAYWFVFIKWIVGATVGSWVYFAVYCALDEVPTSLWYYFYEFSPILIGYGIFGGALLAEVHCRKEQIRTRLSRNRK